jgi:hypothetical protein
LGQNQDLRADVLLRFLQAERRMHPLPIKSKDSQRLYNIAQDSKFLWSYDKEITERGQYLPIPFHSVQLKSSPTYERIFQLLKQLKIPLLPAIRSADHATMNFNPFRGYVEYPATAEEQKWLLLQKPTARMYKKFLLLNSFNFSTAHDALHSIFSILIPPPKNKSDLTDYFLFIESLVFAHEYLITTELGNSVTKSLMCYDLIYRPFKPFQRKLDPKLAKADFEAIFIIDYASLAKWSPTKQKQKLPKYAPYIGKRHIGFSRKFIDLTTPKWLGLYRNTPYPNSLWQTKLPSGLERFWLKDYSLPYLLSKPKTLSDLLNWHHKIFRYSKYQVP